MKGEKDMKITSLLAVVLLMACVIVPSVAGATEIHLLCGQWHVIVDPENQKAFGYENTEDTRVTINSEVYMAKQFFSDGSPMWLLMINRMTGMLTSCTWNEGQESCHSAQCQKIDGAPKF
jgi:hypothetical protein